ncbi:MAG: ArnT family glycosyltransferase [Thermaurantimonas sp.]
MKFFATAVLVILISSALYFPFIGNVHLFDWDEINFAEIAREMLESGVYLNAQIDYQTFTEKPPLFMWLQACSMHIFGINEFAARFPNAFLGVVVSIFFLWWGKKHYSIQFGLIWVIVWWSTFLPHLYFKSGIIDPWFNFFIFISLLSIISHYHQYKKGENTYRSLLLAGVFTGFAILTKGPVSLLIISLVVFVYWIIEKFKWYLPFWHFLIYLFTSLFTFGIWLVIDYMLHGPGFIIEFTIRQWELLTTPDAGHRGFFGYHIVVLLLGCLPASAFFVGELLERSKRTRVNRYISDYKRWMTILFFVVLVLFSLVKTKIVHYSSLAYYPLTFIAALYTYSVTKNKFKISKTSRIIYYFQIFLMLVISITLVVFFNIKDEVQKLIEDQFAKENLMADTVQWIWLDFWPVVLAVLLLIFARRFFNSSELKYFYSFAFLHILWIQITLYAHIGNIERISQRSNIEFFKSLKDEDAYITTFNYKSYAHLFYAESKNQENPKRHDPTWLQTGKIDKPVYFSVRKYHVKEFENRVTDAEFMYSKNGFYFYIRRPD